MSREARWRRLREATAQAAGENAARRRELDRQAGEPPAPGDVFVCRATARFPVEWVVLEAEAGGGPALVAPADANPVAGSADVKVPASDPGGPRTLRCGHTVRVGAGELEDGARVAHLAAEWVERALQKSQAMEAGSLRASALEEEVDEDPEYEDWLGEAVASAREALEAAAEERAVRPGGPAGPGAPPAAGAPPPGGAEAERVEPTAGGPSGGEPSAGGPSPGVVVFPRRWLPQALAATFFLATVGLSLWVAELRREVRELAAPVALLPETRVELGTGTRGGEPVEIAGEEDRVILLLILGTEIPHHDQYSVEILDSSGATVWSSPEQPGGLFSRYPLLISRRTLPPGTYRLNLYGVTAGQRTPLEGVPLVVERRAELTP